VIKESGICVVTVITLGFEWSRDPSGHATLGFERSRS
jgi:hypothetical protein